MRRQTTRLGAGRPAAAAAGLIVALLTLCDSSPHAQLAAPGPSGLVMGPGAHEVSRFTLK